MLNEERIRFIARKLDEMRIDEYGDEIEKACQILDDFYEKTVREETVKSVVEQLKQLHEEEVDELMKGGYVAELRTIAARIDFSELDKLLDEEEIELRLLLEEIPEEYRYEMAFYFNWYEKYDYEIFKDSDEIQDFFRKNPEKLAQNIANMMRVSDLCDLELEELLFGMED